MKPKIGVLVVEDSDVVRALLEHIINADPHLEVIASVASAEEAIALLGRISPDVISLDIRLPGMNGFEATRHIMRQKPTPIVVCSASVESDELKITMNALRAGALAVVEKPVGVTRDDYDRLARTLCTQLRIMSEVKVVRQRGELAPSVPKSGRPPRTSAYATGWTTRARRVLGIGASTGGPNAIVQVLNDLGANFPVPILLVQHIMPGFLAGFASWLSGVTPYRAVLAQHGDSISAGHVYMAPVDHHIRLERDGIRLTQEPPIASQRPSATVLFESLAPLGPAAAGVLLTGMGDDGADGLLALRRAGGFTIAEHESSAVIYGMPKAAVDRDAACECLPVADIGARVLEWVAAGQEGR